MGKSSKRKKDDIGLSPYALVFRGEKKMEKPLVGAINFNENEVFEPKIKSVGDLSLLKKSSNISWINIDGLHDVSLMNDVARMFDIPYPIMSDIMNPSVRPQVEEFEHGIFISIKIIREHPNSKKIFAENLSLILCEKVLISFRETNSTIFDSIRERIVNHKYTIRTSGIDYLAFALLDIVIDNYIYITGSLGDRIELIDEEMSKKDPDENSLDEINGYKRELNHLRRYIKPSREMILSLAKMDSEFIRDENRVHFKELQDNINDAVEQTDSYREMLYDMVNIYHTSVSTKLNDIMKVLTIFSVIFIPLTFIVGVYGTNFDYLPEIHWNFGYFAMWGVMGIVVLIMLVYFKRKKWF